MKLYYCENCEKLVPETEVKSQEEIFASKYSWLLPDLPSNIDKILRHFYTKIENYYQNQMPGVIGYCPIKKTVTCGIVREPTEYEYFLYNTVQRKS